MPARSSKISRSKSKTIKSRTRRSKATPKKYWSGAVTRRSNALDIEEGAFALSDPKEIALSLKRSAERSLRRKAGPFQSAMSMLNFYVNRAGKNLPAARIRTLNRAKIELRKLFGRE